MTKTDHRWAFRARFRRHAFGWRSQTPIKRIKEAVSEIKKVARKDPVAAAEGAVLFLGKVSAAIEHVDSSSGAIGMAVSNAIATLVPVIADAPADDRLREKWLDRLWQAVEEDDMPYLELLPEYWGEMCATPGLASRWADKFAGTLRCAWDPETPGGWFKGTYVCLSSLYRAGRYAELLELVELDPYHRWSSRIWGVKALAAQGRKDEAIEYARATNDPYANSVSVARTCEDILLSDGKVEQAYSGYALQANRKTTNLATFRAVASKYPAKPPADILRDFAARTPGREGKWFAAAKSVGLYDEAIELANRTPCDPKTLTRAARDMAASNPLFATEAGMAALRWLLDGYGYDIITTDVSAAYRYTTQAAAYAGCLADAITRIRRLLETASPDGAFAAGIICHLVEHSPTVARDGTE